MSSTLEPRMTTAVNGRRQQQQQQQYHGYGRQQQHHQNHPPHGGSDTDSLSTAWKPPAKDPFAPPSPVRNHHYHNEDAPPASPAAYRTNFGKHKSYTPPDTGTSGQHYHGTGTPPRMGAGRTPRQAAAVVSPPILPRPVSTSYGDDDDDIPFDQRQANLNEAGPSFDENDFVGRGISANNQRRAYNRFDDTTVEEKKVAEYTNLNFVISEEKKQPKSILKKGGRSMSEDESSAEQDDIDEEDSLLQSSPEQQEKHKQQQQQQQQQQRIVSPQKKAPYSPTGNSSTVRQTALKKGTMTKAQQRAARAEAAAKSPRTQQAAGLDDSELDDDTSLDVPYGSVPMNRGGSLRKRSEQAWTKRSNAVTGKKKNKDANDFSNTKPKSLKKDVSFGAKNSVHEFQPDEEDEEDNQTAITGLTGVSLNSTYTKSMDSEVEDMVKDFFFIGNGASTNPGRRKIKQNPTVKRKLAAKKEEKEQRQNQQPQQHPNQFYNEQEYQDESTLGDSTLDTYGDATLNTLDFTIDSNKINRSRSLGNARSSSSPSNTTSGGGIEDDPVAALWGFMEGGVNAVGGLLGYTDGTTNTERPTSPSEQTATSKDSNNNKSTSSSKGGVSQGRQLSTKSRSAPQQRRQQQQQQQEQVEDDYTFDDDTKSLGSRAFADMPGDSQEDEDITPSSSQETTTTGSTAPSGGFADFMNFATSYLVGTEGKEREDYPSPQKELSPQSERSSLSKQDTFESKNSASKESMVSGSGIENDGEVISTGGATQSSHSTRLDREERLLALAIHAARAKHEVYGYELLDTSAIDVTTQIKFNVIKVSLPMGILFQENGGGCWVTKVFPTGNAALYARGGNVEAGDQLAAINGVSAAEMKVDKICALVGDLPEYEEIELTFLRYTGPLQGASNKGNQGVEVEDLAVSTTSTPSRTRSWKNAVMKKKNRTPTNKQQETTTGISFPGGNSSTLKISEATDSSPALTQQDGTAKEKRKFKIFGRGKNKSK